MPACEIIRVVFGFRIPMPGAVGNTSSRSFCSTLFGSIPADSYYNCPTGIVFIKIVEIFITALSSVLQQDVHISQSPKQLYARGRAKIKLPLLLQRRIQGCPFGSSLFYIFILFLLLFFFFFCFKLAGGGPLKSAVMLDPICH